VPRRGVRTSEIRRPIRLGGTSWRQNTSGLAKAPNSGQKATKQSLTSAEKDGKSQKMNPTQKQFSLNRAASKEQIPISRFPMGAFGLANPLTLASSQLNA